MSIPVDVADLATTLRDFGAGYLLTSDDEGRVKAVSVRPVLDRDVLTCVRPGRGSVANATSHPSVTLLYPPRSEGGHSLLVDGTAVVVGDAVQISAESAVLHRPAATTP